VTALPQLHWLKMQAGTLLFDFAADWVVIVIVASDNVGGAVASCSAVAHWNSVPSEIDVVAVAVVAIAADFVAAAAARSSVQVRMNERN
jgi:hypothetical protein